MKKRNTGINLFKLFSMFMIALLHVLGMGGITGAAAGTSSYYPVYLMQNAAFCAVNCYALVSGYLMLGKKIKPSRITELWFEVFFYSVSISAIMMIVYRDLFSARNIVYAVTPIISNQYWYMTSYFMMYLFVPMMNKFADAANKKVFTATIVVILVLTTGSLMIKQDGFRLNDGYSPIWLMIMYLVGAYMKKFNVGAKMKKWLALLLYVISSLCSFILCVFSKKLLKIMLGNDISYLSYTSPFVVLSAIFLFIFFSKLKFGKKTEKFINYITPAALGVYLIHTHPLVFNKLMKDIAMPLVNHGTAAMIFGSIAMALAVFITCIVIDLLRIQLFRLIRVNALCKKLDGVFNSKKKKTIEIEEPAIEAGQIEETINI
ncbi:MAG: acyltransferase family protein [Oscillospiraceae bacterium]|nr:acyltransferase family protein [Oscillospiraceae bacterium]MDD6983526.1 acyltransferase family protein [Oscillospiraceae bacterium]MDY4623683.1 acyltransferase family protein [Oscillospiraceae bacterium]